jgi:DNA (cytosine-5)-methyltransferase 1
MPVSKMLSPFTYIDLFSGIGGFRLALDAAGGVCTNFSEISRDAVEAYCANFAEGSERNLGDITKIKRLKPHDILTAGVPCQSWSTEANSGTTHSFCSVNLGRKRSFLKM